MLILQVLLSIFATASVQACNTELTLIQNMNMSVSRFAVCGHGKCRGLLWRPQWIITTAHCVEELPVSVYHLHDEDSDCAQAAFTLSDEKKNSDKVLKLPTKNEKADIAFVHLMTPYPNTTHINMMPQNYTRDYAFFQELLDHIFQDVNLRTANKSNQLILNSKELKQPKKTPHFNIFATTFLIPLTFFLVLYLLLSFFSRNPPPTPTSASSNITGKYCLFRKSGYQDTYV